MINPLLYRDPFWIRHDHEMVGPGYGLPELSLLDVPNIPVVDPVVRGFQSIAGVRRFSVRSSNYLSEQIARRGGWLAMQNIEAGHEKTGAFTLFLTMIAASVPQAFSKISPYTNPYTGIPVAVLDLYNIHQHGVEYLWE